MVLGGSVDFVAWESGGSTVTFDDAWVEGSGGGSEGTDDGAVARRMGADADSWAAGEIVDTFRKLPRM